MRKIALCICTRNRPDELRQALISAHTSSLVPAQLLVSDDSDDARAERCADVCTRFAGVTYVRGPRRGLSANRNHCLDRLGPDIEAAAFIDDDVTLRPDFLLRAVEAMTQAPSNTIITGHECNNGKDVTPRNCSFWGHQEVAPRGAGDYHTIVINATLFPRPLFALVRFDELLRYGSEEADICAQAEALGYRIHFSPALVNEHHPSPVNRCEYERVVEASRLYSTYKRYRWLERNVPKALAFAALAPLHFVASIVKARRIRDVPAALSTVLTVFGYLHAEGRRRKGDPTGQVRREEAGNA